MDFRDRKRSVNLENMNKERADEIKDQLMDTISKVTEGINGKIEERLKTTETRANKKCRDILEDIEVKLNEYFNVYGLEVKAKIKLQVNLEYEKKKN